MYAMLDDAEAMRQLDSQGMLKLLQGYPRQLEEGLAIGAGLVPGDEPAVGRLLFCGMGGSAIAGELLRSYLGGDLKFPVVVNRGYGLPAYAAAGDLVFASSYSGNTEETLSAAEQALQRGCRVICLTSGGKLEEMALRHGLPLLGLPPGLPPRAALPVALSASLSALSRLSLISDRSREIRGAVPFAAQRIAAMSPGRPLARNEAKNLAQCLHGRLPVVYASQNYLDAVARRWCNQICENANQLAFASPLPEANHNEIVGWENPPYVADKCVAVFLRDSQDHPRIARRIEITRRLLESREVPALEFSSQGDSLLQRFLSLILLIDAASLYLAALNDVDPFAVDAIDLLKKRLAES